MTYSLNCTFVIAKSLLQIHYCKFVLQSRYYKLKISKVHLLNEPNSHLTLKTSLFRLLQSANAARPVSSPLINVMLNADSLVALPLLLILQVNISISKPKPLVNSPPHCPYSCAPQNLSDVDSGLTPYALLNQNGALECCFSSLHTNIKPVLTWFQEREAGGGCSSAR